MLVSLGKICEQTPKPHTVINLLEMENSQTFTYFKILHCLAGNFMI